MIAGVVMPLIEMQKAYGRNLDMKIVLRGWEMVMADNYTGKQVVDALQVYIKRNSDFPAPADLIKIIDPPKRKITFQEYYHACEQHKLEGYPQFGYYKQIMNEYTGEEEAPKETFKIENNSVRELLSNSIKRIGE